MMIMAMKRSQERNQHFYGINPTLIAIKKVLPSKVFFFNFSFVFLPFLFLPSSSWVPFVDDGTHQFLDGIILSDIIKK